VRHLYALNNHGLLDINFIIFKMLKFSKKIKLEKKFNQHIQSSKISKTWSNSRIQFASNESKLVPRNFDPKPHLKWV